MYVCICLGVCDGEIVVLLCYVVMIVVLFDDDGEVIVFCDWGCFWFVFCVCVVLVLVELVW